MLKNLPASRKILVAFLTIAGLGIVAGVAMLLATLSVARSGETLGVRLAPLVHAAMEIKLHGATAMHRMGTILSDDRPGSIDVVVAELDAARSYARATVEGGRSSGWDFVATESAEVRDRVATLLGEIDGLEAAMRARHDLVATMTGAGSGPDAEFDALYGGIIEGIAAASTEESSAAVQRAVGEARFRLANGHLLLEEILGGDLGEDFGQVAADFDLAATRLGDAGREASQRAAQLDKLAADIGRLLTLAAERHRASFESHQAFRTAEELIEARYATFLEYADAIEGLIQEKMTQGLAAQTATRQRAVVVSTVFAVAVMALVLFSYRWLDTVLGRRMKTIADAMERLSAGDLTVSVPDWGTTDEIGLLRGKLDDLRRTFEEQKRLEAAVAEEREAAHRGQREAEEARAAADLARRAADEERTMAEERARSADAFARDFARIVDAARGGDFRLRIDSRTGHDDLDSLATSLNEMLATIDSSVRHTIEVMASVAAGDLRNALEGEHRGVFAEMQGSINTTLDELTRIATALAGTSDHLSADVIKLARSSENLAQRSTSQAASLEETTAAITRMSAMVKETEADSAAAARQVKEAAQRAREGETVVSDAIAAVRTIDENARKVGDVISVIDEISFQTNLLALNAGVEAARAGEAGKGFAVVAQEVRALAQRANEAAADISALIDRSSKGVEEGVRLVTRTGDVLRDILEAISQVAQFSDRIAEASRDQSSGISEVAAVITDLDRLTQQNATMADEGMQLAALLKEHATSMEMNLDFFRTGSGGDGAVRAA